MASKLSPITRFVFINLFTYRIQRFGKECQLPEIDDPFHRRNNANSKFEQHHVWIGAQVESVENL